MPPKKCTIYIPLGFLNSLSWLNNCLLILPVWNVELSFSTLQIKHFDIFLSQEACWPRIIFMHLLTLRTTSINLIPKVKLQVSQLLLTSEWVPSVQHYNGAKPITKLLYTYKFVILPSKWSEPLQHNLIRSKYSV